MDRRSFLRHIPGLVAAPVILSACGREATDATAAQAASSKAVVPDSIRVHTSIDGFNPIDKPLEEWRDLLSDQAFRIMFEDGTEPRYSSPLLDNKEKGTYICAACYLPLFPSTTKYESGTGWPSFWKPLEGRLGEEEDTRFGMVRTEYHCKRCGAHQGHVFSDGPEPTGLRYCNNGVALNFVPEGEALPALRT